MPVLTPELLESGRKSDPPVDWFSGRSSLYEMCLVSPQAKLPAQTEVVTIEDLMAHLGKALSLEL